jgi:hypothetical protein
MGGGTSIEDMGGMVSEMGGAEISALRPNSVVTTALSSPDTVCGTFTQSVPGVDVTWALLQFCCYGELLMGLPDAKHCS